MNVIKLSNSLMFTTKLLQGINLKFGKKTEQLSVDSPEFDQWKSALERVLGIGGVEELLSEDEEIEEDIGGGRSRTYIYIERERERENIAVLTTQ